MAIDAKLYEKLLELARANMLASYSEVAALIDAATALTGCVATIRR